jgi:hypothetical protein
MINFIIPGHDTPIKAQWTRMIISSGVNSRLLQGCQDIQHLRAQVSDTYTFSLLQ